MYTEVLFPENDIHFIAENDGVDSEKGENDFTPLRNLFNEWYARDTSKKIRAVFQTKGSSGNRLSSQPGLFSGLLFCADCGSKMYHPPFFSETQSQLREFDPRCAEHLHPEDRGT